MQLAPGQSCFIKLYNDGESFQWEYSEQIASYRIDGNWNVSFKEGSPQLPASYHIQKLIVGPRLRIRWHLILVA